MFKTGVVLFDNPNIPGQAWAARANESAFRIASPEALSTDTVWLLGMDAAQMYAFGLSGHAIFRGNDFLRTRLDVLSREVLPLSESNAHRAETLAKLFERQVLIYQRFIEKNVSREQWVPHPFSLRQAIRESLLPYDPDFRGAMELMTACNEALQEFVRCMVYVDKNKGTMTVPIVLPRINHAKQIFRCEVPSSLQVKKIKGFPRGQEEQVAWCASIGKPMLLQVTVHAVREDMASVLSYGGITAVRPRIQGTRGTTHRAMRSWMTSNEFLWLAPIAKIEIHDAMVFEESGTLEQLPAVREFFDLVTEADEAGISAGLFAENLWTAVTTQHAHPMKKLVSANVLAPFFRAHERFLCFQKAKVLADAGYQVSGYGTGKIFLVFEEDEFLQANVFKAAALIGAVPPMIDPDYPHTMGFSDMLDGKPAAYVAMMNVIASGQWQTWVDFDEQLVDNLVGQ